VRCPKSAKPDGCRFALQAVSAKPREIGNGRHRHRILPKPESAVARVKLGAGRSALVTLKPKARFAHRLEAAANVLVREVATVNGTAHTDYRRLKVVG
jgi:hypothetical protein